MIDLALTWRNSRPANSPLPTWRSTTSSSGKRAPCGPSWSTRVQRTTTSVGEHVFVCSRLVAWRRDGVVRGAGGGGRGGAGRGVGLLVAGRAGDGGATVVGLPAVAGPAAAGGDGGARHP